MQQQQQQQHNNNGLADSITNENKEINRRWDQQVNLYVTSFSFKAFISVSHFQYFDRAKRFYSKMGFTTIYDWPIRNILDEAEDFIVNDAQVSTQ